MSKFITPMTYPLGADGRFQSSVAEAFHQEAQIFGLTREATRRLIQAFKHADEASCKNYEDAYRRCVRCHQSLAPKEGKSNE